MDESGPVEALPPEKSGSKRGAVLKYANGIKVIHKDGYGTHFFGGNGEVKVNRGRFELIIDGKMEAGFKRGNRKTSLGSQVKFAEKEYLKDAKVKLYKSRNHISDFLECVKSRKKPITSEIIGARSAICCHLMNQTYYNNQKISWDPKKLTFAPGTGDPKWLTREYRSPWSV
jgi:hypothetical protein